MIDDRGTNVGVGPGAIEVTDTVTGDALCSTPACELCLNFLARIASAAAIEVGPDMSLRFSSGFNHLGAQFFSVDFLYFFGASDE